MIMLTRNETKFRNNELVKRATSGEKANRVLWSAVALTYGGTSIGFNEQLRLSQSLANGFNDQDPLFQFVLVPVLNQRIPETFAAARAALPKHAGLKASEKVLARRIDMIKQLETTATKLVKLPWSRIKISVLSDVAQAYEDFCNELGRLSPPEGITPEELAEYKKGLGEMLTLFREKGKTIRTQVMELAAEFPVSPYEAGMSVGRAPASVPAPIDVKLLQDTVGAPSGEIYKQWEEAQKARSWARAGFFFGQLKEKGGANDATLSMMRSVSLAMSGARPEAVAELESVLSSTKSGQSQIKKVLHSQYVTSTAVRKAAKFGEQEAAK
jgi:hypothetical protein